MLVHDLKHLIARSSLDRVSLDRVKAAVNKATTSQVAQVLGELEPKEQVVAFRLLEKNRAIQVFEMLDPGEQTGLVRAMEDPELVQLLEGLDPDDRVRLFEEFPAKVTKRLLEGLSPEARETVNLLLGYPEGSAGRMMSSRYQVVRAGANGAAALAAVRASSLRADELRLIFVIDGDRFYQGYVASPTWSRPIRRHR
ncbi:hypothetical protein BH24DEI1_BH24DEI1_18210 [soil metagenome]